MLLKLWFAFKYSRTQILTISIVMYPTFAHRINFRGEVISMIFKEFVARHSPFGAFTFSSLRIAGLLLSLSLPLSLLCFLES